MAPSSIVSEFSDLNAPMLATKPQISAMSRNHLVKLMTVTPRLGEKLVRVRGEESVGGSLPSHFPSLQEYKCTADGMSGTSTLASLRSEWEN